MRYVPSREASRILGVHPQTLRKWAREGRIDYIRTEGGQRRYDVDSYLGQSNPAQTVCYCRVSSKNSQPTSPGRSPSCESDIQTLRSSATSDQDSTSGAKAYLPYWNDYTREISSVLWSPTETVLQGLGRNSSRPCWNATAGNSWFSISGTSAPRRSSRLTFSPFSRSLEPGSTGCGDTVRKSKKIRLYPDARQRAELRRWFGAARYAYNRTVELLTRDDAPPAVKTKVRDVILPSLPS